MDRCLILLSSYNGEKYIEEQIDSVLAQKNVDISILVRDDGSNDKTLDILERYKKSGCLDFYCGENLKPAKSFLDLIHRADSNYDFYAFCDQDDFWMPNKVSKAIEALKNISNNTAALYSGAADVVDKDLKHIRYAFHDNTYTEPFYDIVMCGAAGCTYVFNNNLMKELKRFKPEKVSMHDTWVSFVCLAVGGKFYSDKNAYIKYRQHDMNVMGVQKKSLKNICKEIVKCPGTRRSDMTQELLKGYSTVMNDDIKELFTIFAKYKDSFNYKFKILKLKINVYKTDRRAFYKIKLKVIFNSL